MFLQYTHISYFFTTYYVIYHLRARICRAYQPHAQTLLLFVHPVYDPFTFLSPSTSLDMTRSSDFGAINHGLFSLYTTAVRAFFFIAKRARRSLPSSTRIELGNDADMRSRQLMRLICHFSKKNQEPNKPAWELTSRPLVYKLLRRRELGFGMLEIVGECRNVCQQALMRNALTCTATTGTEYHQQQIEEPNGRMRRHQYAHCLNGSSIREYAARGSMPITRKR